MGAIQVVEPRVVKISTRTEIDIRRTLPHAHLNRIGAWVFLDHFGPTTQVDGMKVAAHPHTGLQTVTWLFEGAVDHRDSIGSEQTIRPGQLNLMTAGSGIAHSEKSLGGPAALHAVQLWLALPDAVRHMTPMFQHVEAPREVRIDSLLAKVFIGELTGVKTEAVVFSELVGAELALDGQVSLPLNKRWEHGILVVEGEIEIDGQPVRKDQLAYLAAGSGAVRIEAKNFVGILIGGAPFDEKIVMWWNFIGRSGDEIVAMREAWNEREYPEFTDELGGWIPAPELPNVTLRAR